MFKIALFATLVACGPEPIVSPDAPSEDVCCGMLPDEDAARVCLGAGVPPGTCGTFDCRTAGSPVPRRMVVCAPKER